MPRPSSITEALICEVAARRRAGEPWKAIARCLSARGLPSARHYWWEKLRDVREHHGACSEAEASCTQA